MSNSTSRQSGSKARPKKPYEGYPLTAHPTGYWAKKIRGKLVYFARWGRQVNGSMQRLPGDGWQDALDEYNEQKDDLFAGRTPRVKGDGLNLAELCNKFLTCKQYQIDAGEITPRTFCDYKATTDRLITLFGKSRFVDDLASDDFEGLRADIAKAWGPIRLGNEIQRVRTVFKYGYETGLIDKPVRYGPAFKKPAKHVLRKHKAANGKRLFETADIRELLNAASVQMKAMILLGVNCGFGNADCGTLPITALDLDSGWIEYARPKTGVPRRCPLWPETISALQAVLASRPQPKNEEDSRLVFITKYGAAWTTGGTSTAVSSEMRKLMQATGTYRTGFGFYTLRHIFRTASDATRDFPAIRLVMGHADQSIDDAYREQIDDARLVAVTDHVRDWLFAEEGGTG